MKCLYYHIVIWIYRKNKYSEQQAGPFVCHFSQVSITALDMYRLMRFCDSFVCSVMPSSLSSDCTCAGLLGLGGGRGGKDWGCMHKF